MGGKGLPNESINHLITKMFLDQSLASPGSANYWIVQVDFPIYLPELGTDCFAYFPPPAAPPASSWGTTQTWRSGWVSLALALTAGRATTRSAIRGATRLGRG